MLCRGILSIDKFPSRLWGIIEAWHLVDRGFDALLNIITLRHPQSKGERKKDLWIVLLLREVSRPSTRRGFSLLFAYKQRKVFRAGSPFRDVRAVDKLFVLLCRRGETRDVHTANAGEFFLTCLP